MPYELFTLPQVAQQVGVTYDRLAYHLRQGRLPESYRAGCHILFTAEQIDQIRQYFQRQDERKGEAK